MSSSNWTFVRICGAVGLGCAAWNLFGDLYFLDFYTAQLSMEQLGGIRDELQSGYLFGFDKDNWWVAFLAQSGGWMYPIWAFVTTVPLYMGLTGTGETNFWKTVAPCALMAYGLVVVGGALHSACAFVTVLPSLYHFQSDDGWSDLKATQDFSVFVQMSQARIIQHIAVGCFPGYVACNVAGIWSAVIVHFGNTKFPKAFNWFNPMVTIFWVQVLGALLPDPWSFYLVGSLGTWGLMFFNLGTMYYLWDVGAGIESLSTTLLIPKGTRVLVTPSPAMTNYKSVQN